MKKGSLVRIKQSGDPKLVGTYGLVVRHFWCRIDGCEYAIIQRLVDGLRDSYHHTSLEVINADR